MKSKTLIEKQLRRKTNRELVETLILAKKNENWLKVAHILSKPRRKRNNLNLEELNKQGASGEKIIIPGKILSRGEIDKKIKVVAIGFSKKAKEKLLKAGCELSSILDEIKLNPSAKGIKILNAESKDSTLPKTRKVFNK